MKYTSILIASLFAATQGVKLVDPIYRPGHVKTKAQKFNAASVAGAEGATATAK